MPGFVPKVQWKKPLNWNQLVTSGGEACIPFAAYVQPETTHLVPVTFPQFSRLPAELQLRILRFCSYATLFQLMHVCSTTRHEAQKLFWDNPDAWYHVSGEWLLAGGFAGHTYDAIDILANVRQVELGFDSMQSFTYDWVDGNSAIAPESPSWTLDERIYEIWELLQANCPRLARVVVSESLPRKTTEPLPESLARIVDMSPTGISVFGASYLRRTIPSGFAYQRCLWQPIQPNDDAAKEWVLADLDWTRDSVLLPPKEFRGP
ncbi:Nn.00g000010.m01.CDS01, partial [Neocucurbitaria sp. VM-36]